MAHELGHLMQLRHRELGQDGLDKPGDKNLMYNQSDPKFVKEPRFPQEDLDLIQLKAMRGSDVLK